MRNGVPPVAATKVQDHPFLVGSVGTVSRVKGTDVFLRAAALTRAFREEIRFQHVGSPDLHRDPGLDEEIADLMSDPRVQGGGLEMLGALPSETVLPRWNVVVSTSRSEGFPLATLEAMAAGLPVVATTVGGLPEQIEHLVSGILVPPDDPEALARWLVRLYDDEQLRRRLGEAARSRVASEFTLKRQAAGLHNAYLKALTLRFGPSPLHSLVRDMT